jgi:hypothetical protein
MSELREKLPRDLDARLAQTIAEASGFDWLDLSSRGACAKWYRIADAVLAIPEIREGLYLYSRKKVKAGKPSREPTLGHSIGTRR